MKEQATRKRPMCAECVWWFPPINPNIPLGECHWKPNGSSQVWIPTKSDDWCSNYEGDEHFPILQDDLDFLIATALEHNSINLDFIANIFNATKDQAAEYAAWLMDSDVDEMVKRYA